jgi:hypothetical protein
MIRKSRRNEIIDHLIDDLERQYGAKSRLLRGVFYPAAVLLAVVATLVCIFL